MELIMHLSESLYLVARELRGLREQKQTEFEWLKSHFEFATKQDLEKMERHIMSKFSELAADQAVINTEQGVAIDELLVSIGGVAGDVKALNDKITELLNAPGTWTPEEEALAVDLRAQGAALVAKTRAAAAAAKDLDDQTVPPAQP